MSGFDPGCVKTLIYKHSIWYGNVISCNGGALLKRFVQGECRTQSTLLPELLDDYITENNPVWVVDVFVDELDLGQLGFVYNQR